jgi:hypothetical protein
MAIDALMTKSIAVNSATSFYPVGPIEVGGSSVDEIYILGRNLTQPQHVVVHVPSAAGTNPTLAVAIESDDGVAFSSAKTTSFGHTVITAAGTYVVSPGLVFTDPTNMYHRIKLTAGGTSPDFGTVTATITPDLPNSYKLLA